MAEDLNIQVTDGIGAGDKINPADEEVSFVVKLKARDGVITLSDLDKLKDKLIELIKAKGWSLK